MNIKSIITFFILHFGLCSVHSQFSNCNFLCNIDFEDEKLVQNGQFGFFNEDRVSCWETTASDRMIEIWGSGFGGVPAYSGNQFAELNANMVSTLYQNFNTGLGGSVEISFAHRGRAGIDRMGVKIGPALGPFVDLGTFSADNKKWEFNILQYNFPKSGPIDYTIRFESISAAGGATVGNFLDAISIKLEPPKAVYTITNPLCPNDSTGAIELVSIHGSKPFHYEWLSPFTSNDSILYNLSEGKYKLNVYDYFGCKNSYFFTLNSTHKSDTTKILKTSCQSYTWPSTGETFYTSGTYVNKSQNIYGCDSIIKLQLKINAADTQIITVSNCSNYTWPLNGATYTKSGQYEQKLSNRFGCDSTIILDLTILESQAIRLKESHCKSYYWPANQVSYTQSGSYTLNLTNIYGCDSILILDLEIHEPDFVTQKINACGLYTWPVNGKTYLHSALLIDTLINCNNCDSIISLDLSISAIDSSFEYQSNCNFYFWPISKETYTNSGRYTQTYQNINSCDSIVVLNLTISPSSTSIQSVVACDFYQSEINRKTYTQSGTSSIIVPNSFGCDSTITLSLKINKSINQFDSITTCDSYYWPVNKQTYTKSGDHTAYFQTVESCDSILHLYLDIVQSETIIDTVTSFEYYDWLVNKFHFLQSGTYMEFFQNSFGCDSIRVLVLEIKRNGQIFVPNVFSPNGDHVNDYAIVYSTPEILLIDRFRIFSRWGEMVFEKSDFIPNQIEFGWNGSFRNENIHPGVFTYTVEWTDNLGAKRVHYGDITLLK